MFWTFLQIYNKMFQIMVKYGTFYKKSVIFKYIMEHITIMDEKDAEILKLLRENGKFTTRQIASKLLMPVTTVHNRIRKMQCNGVIKGYSVLVDHKKMGNTISAFVSIKVKNDPANGVKLPDLVERINSIKGVEEVHNVTGETDIVAKIMAKSTEELNEILLKDIMNIEGVNKTQTSIVLSSST